MVLSSAITKRLDAAWAVGSGNGGLDTGTIANTTYHVWLIQRSDTGVVDALFSTSLTSPTMPTNYDRKRRIGIIVRSAGAILPFLARNRCVLLDPPVVLRSSTAAFSEANFTVLSGAGVIRPIIRFVLNPSSGSSVSNKLADGDKTVRVAQQASSVNYTTIEGLYITNSSGQLKFATEIVLGSIDTNIWQLLGWYDDVQ